MLYRLVTTFLYFCIVISKNTIKLIHSLGTKKGREKTGLFVAEGPKVVGDLRTAGFHAEQVIEDPDDVRHVSFLQHPQGVLGVFRIPEYAFTKVGGTDNLHGLVLALDGVQDPGNVGTIIRVADWFGIEDIVCSAQTADCWSPKVIQATMGSIARVRVRYVGDLARFISTLPDDYPVYGTLLNGKNIYSSPLTEDGLIVMGNEGNGISNEVRPLIKSPLLIPNYPEGRSTADSLNVAIATAVTCAEFRRRVVVKG